MQELQDNYETLVNDLGDIKQALGQIWDFLNTTYQEPTDFFEFVREQKQAAAVINLIIHRLEQLEEIGQERVEGFYK